MPQDDFSPIWEFGTVPLRTVAAFSLNAQICPTPLLGAVDTDLVKFEIPKFQRGLVWSKKKKKNFLLSLLHGWPTGAIVLTKINSRNLNSGRREFTWHVIDGQQRLSTFFQFREGFWSEPWYVPTLEMEEAFTELAETLAVTRIEDISTALTLLTQGDATHPFSEAILEESMIFLARICRVLNVESPTPAEGPRYEKALGACRVIRTSLQNQKIALDAIPVAVITISPRLGVSARDARSISSQIFTALNSGIPLSKYDFLAAKWVGEYVPWPQFAAQAQARSLDEAITSAQKKYMLQQMRTRIESSYKDFLEDVELDEASIEELPEDEVSLFDFLYALSKSTGEYATRVAARDQLTVVSRMSFPAGASAGTIGFDTCSLLFSGSLGPIGIENLTKTFPLHHGEYDIGLVSEHYLDAAKEIDSKLSAFTKYSTKNKKKASLGAIQASVYLASYINAVFDVSRGESDRLTIIKRTGVRLRSADGVSNFTSQQRKSNFRENLPSWWLLHTLSDVFQGSDAYKQAAQQVWLQFEGEETNSRFRIQNARENDYLLYQPPLTDLLSVFKALFVKEFRVSQAPLTRSPSQSALALFHCAYKGKNAEMLNFDMDHVVAYRAQRNAAQTRLSKPIPLNHVANWMPLTPTLNRRRGNTPWAQFFLTMEDSDKQTIGRDLFVDPALLVDGTLNDLTKFAEVLMMRYCGIVNQALINVGLNEYLGKDSATRKSVLTTLSVDISQTLGLELDQHRVASNIRV